MWILWDSGHIQRLVRREIEIDGGAVHTRQAEMEVIESMLALIIVVHPEVE